MHDGQAWPLGQRSYSRSRTVESFENEYLLLSDPTMIRSADRWYRYGGFPPSAAST